MPPVGLNMYETMYLGDKVGLAIYPLDRPLMGYDGAMTAFKPTFLKGPPSARVIDAAMSKKRCANKNWTMVTVTG
jgi:hypothetical protein